MNIRRNDAATFDSLCKKLRKIDSEIFPTRNFIGYVLPLKNKNPFFRHVIPIFDYNGEPFAKAYQLLSQDKIDKIKQTLERHNKK